VLVAKFDVDVAYCESNDTYNEVPNLVETSLEGSCDVYVHEESSSLGCDYIFPNPLIIPMFLPCAHNLHFPLSIILNCPLIIL